MIKLIDQRSLNLTLREMSGVSFPKREKDLEEIFLDNLSHEIRTPLNAIIGFNDLLNGVAGQHMSEDEKIVMKNHIHKNADRLLSVMDDILDLSRMEKGEMRLHKTIVSLMEICYKAREGVKYEVREGVKLMHEYPSMLKPTLPLLEAGRGFTASQASGKTQVRASHVASTSAMARNCLSSNKSKTPQKKRASTFSCGCSLFAIALK